MDFPLYKFGAFGDNGSLLVAFLIGLGFGFFLERAGFGSSLKLARQFYFKDMAVLKVMFTAIVTAMLGVYWLSRLGLMDLSQVYLVPTNLWPQVVGGVVLGLGFVVGGYCPGTSVVAAATGRVDAIVYMLGMVAGMFSIGFAMPSLDAFMHSGAMGQVTLAGQWGISYGVLVALVVLVAAAAFLASEWAEVKVGGKERAGQPLLGAKGLTPARGLVLGAVVLGVGAAVAGNPYRGHEVTVDTKELALMTAQGADHFEVETLADRLITGQAVPRLVDLRDPEAFAKYHLPGAENVPMAKLMEAEWKVDEPVLLYSGADAAADQAWMLLKGRKLREVHALQGGLDAWNERVLFPVLPEGATGPALEDSNRRAAVARHFGGQPRGGSADAKDAPLPLPLPPPPADAPAGGPALAKKKPKKEGC